MTCIVGIVDKKNKRVYMGADSAGCAGYNITVRKDPKIFKLGDFIIGCTSSFRMIQLLRFSLKLPELSKGRNVYEYLCTDFITTVRKLFQDHGFMQKETAGDDVGGIFLIAYKNRLFKVERDFQIGESANGMAACGCGESFALGALKALTKENVTMPWYNIDAALQIASELSAGVSKPFIILNT